MTKQQYSLRVSPKTKSENWLHKTFCVIVLYKTNLSESRTFQSLKDAVHNYDPTERIDLLVFDNSPSPQIAIEQFNEESPFRIHYLHDSQNPGVSRAYNRGAELAADLNKTWLLIFDQDTAMPADTLFHYQKALDVYPNYPVYAPQLYSGSLLYSPCRYRFGKGSNLPHIEPGIHSTNHRGILNSGLLIQLQAFRRVGGYDDTVRLYFSDLVFFGRLKKVYSQFVVVDCRLEHQLSSVDYGDKSVALNKFAAYCAGARQASRGNGFAYVNQGIMVGLRSLRMSWRFKSWLFPLVFFKTFC